MDHTSAGPATGPAPDRARPVPFFTQAASFEDAWSDIRARVTEVIDDGKYSHGRQVGRWETALAEWTGARHCVAVNSGTDALVLLLRACGLGQGDEVVVPAFSFVATASSVVLAGGRPVFADIDPVTYTLDPDSASDAVTGRTTMLMPVHLFCQLADMGALARVAERHGLTLVEDSAEAIGMRWNGVHAGLLGAGGVLSFFPTKTLGALGDAGAVLTDDPRVAATVSALRHHGRTARTLAHFPGISSATELNGVNSKMDDLQAAVLLGKLPRLARAVRHRAALAAAYTERLRDVPGLLRLPTLAAREAATDAVFYVYLVEAERRDALAAFLADHGVGTETYYPVPLHLQPCFAGLGYRHGQFPHAEAACERTLALPFHPDLTTADLDTVCALVRRFFTGRPV
ncbi:UDP-2-acetamido-2-deoxy-ribo-hexuluronate aminotransferase [Streptomyces sp. B3I7]|uniref:DegT/DnrJ/EryC1/StrS family aminotransferase n=1 Tax=Streptomyces sp. B3I7 TaxID=3042269 RepID=UPI00278B50E7|nr:DegT/DnrJ/EryC1/StrS family aminotransferase [Streptomyces sp. B3I7]MDQ0809022.1 UDP-2-acetamido-2-deoxy-ribo-hexuluronate aminotransferase [Streptomyces sp. B3I7]